MEFSPKLRKARKLVNKSDDVQTWSLGLRIFVLKRMYQKFINVGPLCIRLVLVSVLGALVGKSPKS